MGSTGNRQQGRVSQWSDKKGYGFVTASHSGARLFFHISDFKDEGERPLSGSRVTFCTQHKDKGKPRAVQVQFTRRQRIEHALVPGCKQRPVWLLSILMLTILASLYLARVLSMLQTGTYIALSIITYTAYAIDKRAAKRHHWRIKETSLHVLSGAGGWPGALLAHCWRNTTYGTNPGNSPSELFFG